MMYCKDNLCEVSCTQQNFYHKVRLVIEQNVIILQILWHNSHFQSFFMKVSQIIAKPSGDGLEG